MCEHLSLCKVVTSSGRNAKTHPLAVVAVVRMFIVHRSAQKKERLVDCLASLSRSLSRGVEVGAGRVDARVNRAMRSATRSPTLFLFDAFQPCTWASIRVAFVVCFARKSPEHGPAGGSERASSPRRSFLALSHCKIALRRGIPHPIRPQRTGCCCRSPIRAKVARFALFRFREASPRTAWLPRNAAAVPLPSQPSLTLRHSHASVPSHKLRSNGAAAKARLSEKDAGEDFAFRALRNFPPRGTQQRCLLRSEETTCREL